MARKSLTSQLDLPDALRRIGGAPLMRRLGVGGDPAVADSADTAEVRSLLADPGFDQKLRTLADKLDRPAPEVRAEAAGYLREMAATHGELASDIWGRFGRWILRAYDVFVDDDQIRGLRALDRRHSLVLLPSHRSYLDAWMHVVALGPRGISPPFGMGGANLNFFPFGTVASRTGMVFIRRAISDLPVYRLALRTYIGELARVGANFAWAIEGGRTRTGKLRPPKYGLTRYLVDGVEAVDGPEVYLVPMSIVYDQLHELTSMTSEARGERKRQENLQWLVRFARDQRHRLGRAYLDIGEPIPLRQRLAELRGEDPDTPVVERVSLDVCHRINRATPVTTTSVVSLAMLGADRALTLDEVLATVAPLADYIARRRWPVAGAANLTDRATIRRTLQELVASGVFTCYDGGPETVWGIGPEQHLIAAFYRNTAIHMLVDRSIGELALLAAAESPDDSDIRQVVRDEALRLRELLKFEFFFSARDQFLDDLRTELRLVDPQWQVDPGRLSPGTAREVLRRAQPLLAHLVLRPFLDSYHVLADRLAAAGEEPVDTGELLDQSLRLGRQWALQRKLGSEESVSLELFNTALRLAAHRDLVDSAEPHLGKRRLAFAEEIRRAVARVRGIAELTGANAPTSLPTSLPTSADSGS